MDLPTYPNLVQEFHGNAKVGYNSIELEVKKIKITLNANRLGYLLRAPVNSSDRLEDNYSGLWVMLGREVVVEFKEILAN